MKNSSKFIIALAGTGAFCAEGMSIYKKIMGREDQIQTPIQKIFGRIFSSCDDITTQKIDELAKNMKSKPFQKFNIVSKRGEKLAGFYYEPKKYSHPNTIVIGNHGYHTNHFGDPATYIEYYLKNGYGVFTPDHIASGESEGKYVGFDYFESQDLLEWIKFLESKFGKDTKFILHGTSMGAATVMMLCADKCPESVKLIIEDCGYTCAKDQFEYLIKKAGIKKPETIYNSFNYFNKKIAGYDLSLTDVRNQVKNTKVPILFIHGDKDDFVPFEMVYELYNICPENKRAIKVIHNATHANSAVVNEKEYFDALTDFITAHNL